MPSAIPYGTYLARVQHGALVAEPHPDAIVTAPGMTLDEVKAELADGKRTRVRTLELDEIRDAFRNEAHDIVEVENVELLRAAPSVNASSSASASDSPTAKPSTASPKQESAGSTKAKPPRPGPRVRHRFTRGATEAEQAGDGGASRVVVLRDRRRGRPKKSSDPPE